MSSQSPNEKREALGNERERESVQWRDMITSTCGYLKRVIGGQYYSKN
jgi:hypothetical protein